MRDYLDIDAVEAAEMIRSRAVTSLELTNRYIAHLMRLNPKVNCLSQERFNEARQDAVAVDRKLQEGQTIGRLHGVPISVKECFQTSK